MKKQLLILLLVLVCKLSAFSQSNYATITGLVTGPDSSPIADVNVLLSPLGRGAVTDARGRFSLERIPAGQYTLVASHLGFQSQRLELTLKEGEALTRRIVLAPTSQRLRDVEVIGGRAFPHTSFLPQVEGTNIYAGKKNEAVNLQGLDADLAENLPRQVFSKVPGVMVWEMDGTGNQVGIATRGLNPHRSWELHVQQNGNTTNSDLFGYPESHYNPPMEAVGVIRIVRGSGALQYGPQFGGLLEYELKQPDTTRQISVETQESVGSFGLFSSFNAIGGKVGKLTYYGYYDFRRSEGWRQNSDYHFNAWHASAKYDLNARMSLSAELSHMAYVNHFAAGLTDSLFQVDPRYSNRPRNYFNPTIYLPALHFSWKVGKNTQLSARTSAILGERNSVQFIKLPTINDTINAAINDYNPRQVDRDYYHSYVAEARLVRQYKIFNNESHFLAGARYGNSRTLRKQKGQGTTGAGFDLSLTEPYRIDLAFRTLNYALFAENVFNLTPHFSVTPGFRYEVIRSDMSGMITDQPELELPLRLERNFPLFGVGLEYRFSPRLSAYANFTQNFRPILHSDLIPPTDLDRIDPNLKDASGNNSEIGIRGAWKDIMQFDLNYFRLQYDNRIGTLVLNDANGPYFFHTNIGDMANQGGELFVEFHPFKLLGLQSKFLNISLFSSTSYNSAYYTRGTVTVDGENEDIEGNAVENVPHWISRNGITYRYHKFSTTLQFSYVSENYSDALNTISTPTGVNGIVPSYLITDFNFTYHFLGRFNVRCSVNNVTDEKYFTRRATGYPGPGILPSDGRSVVVSFGAKL
ncbi:MAG: TonB-dependent receptor [Lewinellaceae bacterium]|nr:TonB-dependent receptor [Lewinellaceae bacterium]